MLVRDLIAQLETEDPDALIVVPWTNSDDGKFSRYVSLVGGYYRERDKGFYSLGDDPEDYDQEAILIQ